MRKVFSRELVGVFAAVGMANMAMSLLQPVLPLYLTSIGVSPTAIGLMLSTAMAGMVLGEGAGGWLADRMGMKVPMMIGTLVCAPMVLSFIFTTNAAAIFVIFFLWGLARSAVFGPGRGYIGANISFSHMATFMAIFGVAMAASRSLGTFASGFVAGAWGYDADFIVAAGIGVVGGAIVLIGMRSRSRTSAPHASSATTADPSPPVVPLYRHRPFIFQSVIAALYFVGRGVLPFLSLKASEDIGLPLAQIGMLFTASAVVSAVLLVPMGRLADRKSKKAMMTIGLLVTAASCAGIASGRNFFQLVVSQMIGSAGGSMFSPAAVAMLSENVAQHRQSTAMGVYGSCEDVGVIIGSAIGGVVWSSLGSSPTFLLVGTCSAALGAIMSFTLLKERAADKTSVKRAAEV